MNIFSTFFIANIQFLWVFCSSIKWQLNTDRGFKGISLNNIKITKVYICQSLSVISKIQPSVLSLLARYGQLLVTGSVLTQPPVSKLFTCAHCMLPYPRLYIATGCTIQVCNCQTRPYLAKWVSATGHWLSSLTYSSCLLSSDIPATTDHQTILHHSVTLAPTGPALCSWLSHGYQAPPSPLRECPGYLWKYPGYICFVRIFLPYTVYQTPPSAPW